MTQSELDKLAREAEADPSAMANFGMLLGFLYLAGELRIVRSGRCGYDGQQMLDGPCLAGVLNIGDVNG